MIMDDAMSKLNQYQPILDRELRANQITVIKWRPSSSGCAHHGTRRTIECPRPTDEDRLHVGFHEIGHVILGHTSWGKKPQYVEEFECDMFAYRMFEKHHITVPMDVFNRTDWHILSRLAMAHNRKLNHAKIPAKIMEWLNKRGFDISSWVGNTVYISTAGVYEWDGLKIEMVEAISLADIKMLLGREGLMVDKSESDDSTYGHYIVRASGRYGLEFNNLAGIIKHYKLTLKHEDIGINRVA